MRNVGGILTNFKSQEEIVTTGFLPGSHSFTVLAEISTSLRWKFDVNSFPITALERTGLRLS